MKLGLFSLLLALRAAVCVSQCSFSTQGFSFDFSPLANKTFSVSDQVGYLYEFQVCSVVSDSSACAAKQGSICQFQPGQQPPNFLALIAAWPGGLFSLVDPNNATAGVRLHFTNGDSCNGSPRTSDMLFVCDPSLIGNITMTSVVGGCSYQLVIPTSLACPMAPSTCTFASDGATYNLSALVLANSTYTVYNAYNNQTYLLNVCQPVRTEPVCAAASGIACSYWSQPSGLSFLAALARDSLPAIKSSQEGLQLVYTTGDSCIVGDQAFPRTTTYFFTCDSEPVGAIQVATGDPCYDTIVFPTKYACV